MFLCNEKCIDVLAKNKAEALEKLVEIAYEENIINNKEGVLEHLISREKQYPTDVQENIAIPHTRCEFVNKSTVAILKLKEPISWESENDYKIRVVFAILVPSGSNAGNEHIEILSKIAVMLLEDDFVNSIIEENDPKEIIKKMEECI